jgi:hypothetical protein
MIIAEGGDTRQAAHFEFSQLSRVIDMQASTLFEDLFEKNFTDKIHGDGVNVSF